MTCRPLVAALLLLGCGRGPPCNFARVDDEYTIWGGHDDPEVSEREGDLARTGRPNIFSIVLASAACGPGARRLANAKVEMESPSGSKLNPDVAFVEAGIAICEHPCSSPSQGTGVSIDARLGAVDEPGIYRWRVRLDDDEPQSVFEQAVYVARFRNYEKVAHLPLACPRLTTTKMGSWVCDASLWHGTEMVWTDPSSRVSAVADEIAWFVGGGTLWRVRDAASQPLVVSNMKLDAEYDVISATSDDVLLLRRDEVARVRWDGTRFMPIERAPIAPPLQFEVGAGGHDQPSHHQRYGLTRDGQNAFVVWSSRQGETRSCRIGLESSGLGFSTDECVDYAAEVGAVSTTGVWWLGAKGVEFLRPAPAGLAAVGALIMPPRFAANWTYQSGSPGRQMPVTSFSALEIPRLEGTQITMEWWKPGYPPWSVDANDKWIWSWHQSGSGGSTVIFAR